MQIWILKSNKTKFNIQSQTFIIYSKFINLIMIHLHRTLISFQSPVLWFHFNQNDCKCIHHSVITTIIFNHSEAYRYMCNHGTLIFFQPPVHWFHFNQNDYIQVYKSVINITHQFQQTTTKMFSHFFLTSLLKTVQLIISNHNK